MNDTKEKKISGRIVISSMILTIVLITELYLMINHAQVLLIPIIILGVVALITVYIMIQAIISLMAEKEAQRQAHYANIYKSEKAAYILLKNKFEELEGKLAIIQETSKIPSEEIINAQKGIAKVIINRSKENADAIINSNDQVLERLDEIDETQNTKFTGISKDQRLKLTEMSNQTELKLQDMVVQLKDMELRLNQAIMQSGAKVVVEAAPYEEPVFAEEPAFTEEVVVPEVEVFAEEPIFPEVEVFAEEPIFPDESPVEEAVLEELVKTESPIEESPVEEIDPNKPMSADDIAALFASMTGGSEDAEEVIEEPEVEEVPPMPDLSDPNKTLSPDEIAALIANL